MVSRHAFRASLSGACTFFGIIWALPLTLLGLALALPVLLLRGRAELIRGQTAALVVHGRAADFVLDHHPFGAMSAMAMGHVVLVSHDGMLVRVLTHELEHVRQAARWGIFFPFLYIASSLWALLRGRHAYWHNHFEIAARKAEKHCPALDVISSL